jgi:hypothetical protein
MLASYLLCLHAEPRSSGAFNRKLFGKKDASSWNGYKLKVSFSTVFGAWYALKLLARHSIVLVMLCLCVVYFLITAQHFFMNVLPFYFLTEILKASLCSNQT